MEELTLFSFRIPKALASSAAVAARQLGLSKSAYARRAIEELNRRVMRQRIGELSRRLSVSSAAAARSMEATLSDGLE